jgi:hypothetical protein
VDQRPEAPAARPQRSGGDLKGLDSTKDRNRAAT